MNKVKHCLINAPVKQRTSREQQRLISPLIDVGEANRHAAFGGADLPLVAAWRMGTRLHEHQLAINRKDKLSLVYGHAQQLNHEFAFEKTRVIDRANEKMARLMLVSWFSTGTLT
ncbi:unnamed protein product [Schistocephalus solidus]|uniref:Transposase n=1 Tax=Schistocephalus solidus TaxID=70667 RepID=A0A183SMN3_SCHSO|nr:unnamed protein product [Schistocephalus solidus]